MDYKTMTLEDIDRLQAEIDHFYHLRHLMIGVGWGCMGLGVLIAVIAGINASRLNENTFSLLMWLGALSITGAIVVWILKSALFNQRIKNRKVLIKQATEYRKKKQLFEETDPSK